MTEDKRFYFSSDDNQNIYDTLFKCYYSSIDAEKIYKLLNELLEENIELRDKAFSWKITASVETSKQSELIKQIISLKKENEELKQTIETICKDYEESHGLDIRNAEWFTAW